MIYPENHTEMHIQAKHGRLHCVIAGRGEPLVLLHGSLGTGPAHFREQMVLFSGHYQIIVPTFLGYGVSEHRSSWTEHFYEQDAEDIAAIIQYLGLSSVHLCGFSDGATVAMMVASDKPEMVQSLILIGGATVLDHLGMDVTRQLLPVEQIPAGFRAALGDTHGDPYWKQLVTDYVDALERRYASGGDLGVNRLQNIRCPTLLVQGGADQWVGPEHLMMLREKIKGSQVQLLDGSGHEVQREQPEAFNRLVLGFLVAVNGGGLGAT